MAVLIDHMGSFLLGAMIMVIVLTLNSNMTQSSIQRNLDVISEQTAEHTLKILEYDLYKIGYRTAGNALVKAESLAIIFKADLDDNGIEDSVQYSVGTTKQLPSSSNKNDRPLFRQVNYEPSRNIAMGLVQCLLSYYDVAGKQIPYDTLKVPAGRAKVRTIGLTLKVEPTESIGDPKENSVTIRKIIRPKNINGW